MTLRTYYAYKHEAPPEPEPAEEPDTDDRHNIAWGYNLADVDRCARIAVSRCYARSGAYIDRYQFAWSAIAEALCGPDAPTTVDLIAAGAHAVSRYAETEARHHGVRHGTDLPRFTAYWTPPAATPFADRVVDSLALWSILPLLSEGQRRALHALAATGDRTRAAALLGVNESALATQLSAARTRFLSWWHEGEAPSRLWRRDRSCAALDGTWRGRSRLTERQRAEIRDRYDAGDTQATIAADYSVSEATIQRITAERTTR